MGCIPHRESYVKTSKITCQVQSPQNFTGVQQTALQYMAGPVVVKVLNDYTAKSNEHYTFVNPRITSIAPGKGPKSGGTKLTIWGLHMDAGSSAEAWLGQLYCNVTKREANFAVCITSARHRAGDEKVRMKFDNGMRNFEAYSFLYVEDPSISSVESGPSGQRGEARGIPSGGITITVRGQNLNIVQEPLIYVVVDDERYYGNCKDVSAVEMKCESPPVPDEKLEFQGEESIELDLGFVMDNVREVQNLSTRKYNPFLKFKMHPKPEFIPFADGVKYYKSDYLTINVSVAAR